MGFNYRRRIKTGANSFLNLSKSGASYSRRIGRATFNSRGGGSYRICQGVLVPVGKAIDRASSSGVSD